MCCLRRVQVLVASVWLSGMVVSAAEALPSIGSPNPFAWGGAEFQAFLTRVDAAQLELQNRRAEAFKEVWSHAADVTLAGGFGGTIEVGWEKIGRRLDWVAEQYSHGSNTIERIIARSSGDLGYTVQIEHIRFQVPGQSKESTRDYRVTMLFRREPGGWRIIHRQADSQMSKQAPR